MPLIIIEASELVQKLDEEAKKIHLAYLQAPLKVDNCICENLTLDVYKVNGNTHAINCMLTQVAYDHIRREIYPSKEE